MAVRAETAEAEEMTDAAAMAVTKDVEEKRTEFSERMFILKLSAQSR